MPTVAETCTLALMELPSTLTNPSTGSISVTASVLSWTSAFAAMPLLGIAEDGTEIA